MYHIFLINICYYINATVRAEKKVLGCNVSKSKRNILPVTYTQSFKI